MNIDKFEQWLISIEGKQPSSANSYKSSILRIEDYYNETTKEKELFLNASTPRLKELVTLFENKKPFVDFGLKSNATNINALRALYRYKKSLETLAIVIAKVETLLQTPHFTSLIKSDEFYFQKLTDLFEDYKEFDLKLIEKDITDYLNNEPEKFNFQQLLDNSKGAFKDFIFLLGKMIAVFDEKGYNTRVWNPYEDGRRVSRSMLSQRYWTYNLLEYKLSGFNHDKLQSHKNVAFTYSINFINNPEHQVSIVSKNHRKEIVGCFNLKNDNEIIDLFSNEIESLKNQKNKGVILSHLLYNKEIKEIWLSSISGLMASDSTGWFDGFIRGSKKNNFSIVWNSKRPSGTDSTIKGLANILKNGDSFNIYYSSSGYVRYVATVIDFVDKKEEYNKKKWKENFKPIYGWEDDFSNYKDNKKSANIVFLIESIEKIKPISIDKFKTFKSYQYPRQDNLTPIQLEPDFEVVSLENSELLKTDLPMDTIDNTTTNQILYGPPGTGKTYATKEIAVSIIDKYFIENIDEELSDKDKRKLITDKYDEFYFAGQIVFTTFHQSMSYEDFVEGIKPQTVNNKVIYDIEDGIFKLISDVARDNWEAFTNRSENELAFDDVFNQLKEEWEENSDIKFPLKTEGNDFTIIGFTNKSIQFKKASGGTGHTLSINTLREGFYNKRKIRSTGVGIYYPSILDRLKKYKSSQEETIKLKPYVLIIDEINRGNVSAIFGELITLLEPDKRIGENEELNIKLPYSKNNFGVPVNLHIIGTMNTADRSVEALDTALRRRFEFKEKMPNVKVIKNEMVGEIKLSKVLQTINERIELLIDRDHTIGHSYFVGVDTEEKLTNAFNNKIIPLLQEYFYGDYGKIGLVLGKGFVDRKKNKDLSFSSFKYDNKKDFITPTFVLKPINKSNIINAINKLFETKES